MIVVYIECRIGACAIMYKDFFPIGQFNLKHENKNKQETI